MTDWHPRRLSGIKKDFLISKGDGEHISVYA